MKVAVTVWQERIAPLFDAAGRLALYRIEAGSATAVPVGEIALAGLAPAVRISRMMAAGVDVLVCGAISRPLERLVRSVGIHVISEATGPVADVLRALARDEWPAAASRRGAGHGLRRRRRRRFGGGSPE